MTASIQFGRADGGATPDTVTPVGTAQVGSAQLTGAVNLCPAAGGTTAVRLAYGSPTGSPIVVVNTASTATALLVYPPLTLAGAAAGGKVYGTSTAPAADGSTSIAQGKSATFFPHANGIDFSVVLGG